MKKLKFILLFILISCSYIDYNLTDEQKKIIELEIIEEENKVVNNILIDNKEYLKELLISGIVNNYIKKEIDSMDTRDFIIIFSKNHKILNKNEVESDAGFTFFNDTYYFKVLWIKKDGKWKIYSLKQI